MTDRTKISRDSYRTRRPQPALAARRGRAKPAKRSAFLKWFEAQHGTPPTSLSRSELINQYERGIGFKMMLDRLDTYNARRESALYAWNARGGKR